MKDAVVFVEISDNSIYKLAHKLGCKQITVYRGWGREEQVLSAGGAARA